MSKDCLARALMSEDPDRQVLGSIPTTSNLFKRTRLSKICSVSTQAEIEWRPKITFAVLLFGVSNNHSLGKNECQLSYRRTCFSIVSLSKMSSGLQSLKSLLHQLLKLGKKSLLFSI